MTTYREKLQSLQMNTGKSRDGGPASVDERKQMVNDLIAGSPQEAKRRERIEFEKDPYGGMPRSWFLSEEGNPDAAVHSTDVSEDLL